MAHRPTQVAFSLVEIVLALGVFSFCIIAVLSLFSVGLDNAKESDQEIRAANLTSSILGRIRSAPRVDLSAQGFPFAPVAGETTGVVFEIPTETPIYLRANGLKAATAIEAANGYAAAAAAFHDQASQVTRLTLKLWWPSTAPLSQATGTYTVNTFIDTEAQ